MTLVAVWCNEENPSSPSLWIATDSRLSDGEQRLIDEGVKLFELQVICRAPGEAGFFTKPYYASSYGLASVGHSILYQNVYACAGPLLANLCDVHGRLPAAHHVAEFVARLTYEYVMSLGQVRFNASDVGLVLAGYCPVADRLRAFEIRANLIQGEITPSFKELDLLEGNVHFFGAATHDAARRIAEIRADWTDGILYHRAPFALVVEFVENDAYPTIGGELQAGFTIGRDFYRVATVRPIHDGDSAVMVLNNLKVDEVGTVGPCTVLSLPAMTVGRRAPLPGS